MDDLLFKAADFDGDGRVDRDEYAKYAKLKAKDQAMPESSGATESPKPTLSPDGH